jgi:hypothetical protein
MWIADHQARACSEGENNHHKRHQIVVYMYFVNGILILHVLPLTLQHANGALKRHDLPDCQLLTYMCILGVSLSTLTTLAVSQYSA